MLVYNDPDVGLFRNEFINMMAGGLVDCSAMSSAAMCVWIFHYEIAQLST